MDTTPRTPDQPAEALLRVLVEHSPAGIAFLDRDFRFRHINHKLAEMNGYPPDYHLGKTVAEIIPQLWPTLEPLYRRVLDTGQAITNIEISGEAPSSPGQRRDWIVGYYPVPGADGAVLGLGVMVVEITERKRAEAEAMFSRMVLEHTGDAVLVTEADPIDEPGPRIVYVNRTFEQETGYARAEVLGRSPRLLQGPKTDRQILDQVRAALRQRGPSRVELLNYRKNGTPYWVEMDMRPVAVAEQTYFVAVQRNITRRKELEVELRNFQQMRNFGLLVFVRWGLEHPYPVLHVGDNIRQLGFEPDDFLSGRVKWIDIVHPDDRQRVHQEVVEAQSKLAAGGPRYTSTTYRIVRPDGTVRWLYDFTIAVLEDDQPVYADGYLLDISDLEEAKTRLKASEERFRAFMDHSPPAWITDADSHVLYLSAVYRQTFQLPPGDLIGKSAFELYPAELAQVYADNIREVARSGQILETIEPGLHADGTPGEFLVYKFPLPTPEAVLVGGVAIDVTERKAAEREIRESRATYQRLVNSLEVIVWEADPKTFQFTFVSPQAEAMFGYPISAWLEQPTFWVDHIHEEDRARTLAFCQEECRHCRDHEFEYRMIAADGRALWVVDKVRFATTETGVVRLTGMIQDISARKAAIEVQARLEDQLRQAQKMEAIGQLAGGIAHDFNNLLTVINGCSELLLGRLANTDPMRELLVEIHKAGERAATLTRQLLAFSRRQILKPELLNLNVVISETEKMLRRLIGEDVILTTTLDPGLGPVKADPGQLEQILINLAVNARDAMPRGGSLLIDTRTVTLDEAYCQEHPEVQPGDYVLLTVSDTGVGMSEATQTRVFEPFFTTKGPGRGTGMGLATVHGIVKQSGGHIAVSSQLGQGTTFLVYLPRVREAMPVGKSHPGLGKMPRGHETILLVEDEDAVRALARQVLQTCGYAVLEAANGRTALEVAERHAGPIDLLVSDVVMPLLGGRELVERYCALRPRSRVLLLSGYTDDKIVRHGVLEAEFAFLQKPFTATLLAQKVREVLDGAK